MRFKKIIFHKKKKKSEVVHQKNIISLKKIKLKNDLKDNSDEFFETIKKYVKKSNRIDTLVNQ